MTWIIDLSGQTYWVESKEMPRKKARGAGRFANIKVGDRLMREWTWCNGQSVRYYVVTDLWFDPCRGQYDAIAGQMAAIQQIHPHTGEPRSLKEAHTIRGLASNSFRHSTLDFSAHVKAVNEAVTEGSVVEIGFAKIIRRRPKTPTNRPL